MSDLINREEIREEIFIIPSNGFEEGWNHALNSVYNNAPSADIMECAKAMKKFCEEIDCASCPINYWCGVEDIRPFVWNLPEGERDLKNKG